MEQQGTNRQEPPNESGNSTVHNVMATHDKPDIDHDQRERLVREGKVFYHGSVGEATSREIAVRKLENDSEFDGVPSKQDGPVSLKRMAQLRRDGGLVYLRGNLSLASVDFGRIVYVPPGTAIRVEMVQSNGDTVPLKTMQGKYPVDAPEDELPEDVGRHTLHKLHNENKQMVLKAYRQQWSADNDVEETEMPWERYAGF